MSLLRRDDQIDCIALPLLRKRLRQCRSNDVDGCPKSGGRCKRTLELASCHDRIAGSEPGRFVRASDRAGRFGISVAQSPPTQEVRTDVPGHDLGRACHFGNLYGGDRRRVDFPVVLESEICPLRVRIDRALPVDILARG